MPESSPELEVDISAEAEPANPDVNADSSPAKPGEPSLLDAVKTALDSGKDKEPSPSSERDAPADGAEPKTEGAKTPEDDAPLGDLTPEELNRYNSKTRKRINQLLGERDELRQQVTGLETRAKQFDDFSGYLQRTGLAKEQIEAGIDLVVLANTDKRQAFNRLVPIVQHLAREIGEELSPELQERVQQGYLTLEDARQLSKAQADGRLAQQRAEQAAALAEAERTRAAEAAMQANVQFVSASVSDWEAAKKRTDPDFDLKLTLIGDRAKAEILSDPAKYPKSPQEAVAMMDRIYAQVNSEVSRFRSPPREIRHVNGSASPQALPEPKTAKEAAERALGVR